jgi:adenosylcobinamide kinase/adenosylcobinamide-phosphate guanylyltransferase
VKELILGGARCGKSRLAERIAGESGLEVCYIATATALDAEMAERIRHHRSRRPGSWRLVEEPHALADTLRHHAAADRCLLVDCLTLWLSNLLMRETAGQSATGASHSLRSERDDLLACLPHLPGHIILVSNEVGMGIVPLGETTRRFCDESGRLHQDLAALCERVTLVVAGLPHCLKGTPA